MSQGAGPSCHPGCFSLYMLCITLPLSPLGLCTCCSICLEPCSLFHATSSFSSFRSWLRVTYSGAPSWSSNALGCGLAFRTLLTAAVSPQYGFLLRVCVPVTLGAPPAQRPCLVPLNPVTPPSPPPRPGTQHSGWHTADTQSMSRNEWTDEKRDPLLCLLQRLGTPRRRWDPGPPDKG